MSGGLLSVRAATTGYAGAPVVRRLDLDVERGELVALLGPNGAGKTTTLLALAGVLPLHAGTATFAGRALRGPLHRRARDGIAFISEQRGIFPSLSVAANLSLGRGPVGRAVDLFPELHGLRERPAGLLSGGEQQMLVLARALAGEPRLLLVDELSMGLAPLVVERLLVALRDAAARGTGVLFVEQYARRALAAADRAYVMRRGGIAVSGSAAGLLQDFDRAVRPHLTASAVPDAVAG